MRSLSRQAVAAAPSVVALSLIAGNVGLLVRRGIHPNLETAVGLLWIASDYALRQKHRHPVAAPRLNAAGVILGSLLLSASGIHAGAMDWHRIRTPLGYIPASLVVGFQHELRHAGHRLLAATPPRAGWALGQILQRPYTVAACLNAYGVLELFTSALTVHDHGLLLISAAYGLATLALPLLDN